MTPAKTVRFEIVSREFVRRYRAKPGTGSYVLTLACGHRVRRDAARYVGRVAKCPECTAVLRGAA